MVGSNSPWSWFSSGAVEARRREMRRTFPRHENPYFDSDRIATPYPNSLRSAYWGIVGICAPRKRVTTYLVAAHFELRHIPCRVVMRRPLHKSELSLVRGQVVVKVKREFNCR